MNLPKITVLTLAHLMVLAVLVAACGPTAQPEPGTLGDLPVARPPLVQEEPSEGLSKKGLPQKDPPMTDPTPTKPCPKFTEPDGTVVEHCIVNEPYSTPEYYRATMKQLRDDIDEYEEAVASGTTSRSAFGPENPDHYYHLEINSRPGQQKAIADWMKANGGRNIHYWPDKLRIYAELPIRSMAGLHAQEGVVQFFISLPDHPD